MSQLPPYIFPNRVHSRLHTSRQLLQGAAVASTVPTFARVSLTVKPAGATQSYPACTRTRLVRHRYSGLLVYRTPTIFGHSGQACAYCLPVLPLVHRSICSLSLFPDTDHVLLHVRVDCAVSQVRIHGQHTVTARRTTTARARPAWCVCRVVLSGTIKKTAEVER